MSNPAECDPVIFMRGQAVLIADAASSSMEEWVNKVRDLSGAQVDWHYSGGVAQLLFLGDDAQYDCLEAVIDDMAPKLHGTVLARYPLTLTGVYRRGVDRIEPGSYAVDTH